MNLRYYVLVLQKIVHKPGHFPIRHLIRREIIFMFMEQKKNLTQFSCICYLKSVLICCHNSFISQTFNITFMYRHVCLNYIYIHSNPKFCALVPLTKISIFKKALLICNEKHLLNNLFLILARHALSISRCTICNTYHKNLSHLCHSV